jgi:hypothetical protein
MTTSVTESFYSNISQILTPEEQAQILYIKAMELGDGIEEDPTDAQIQEMGIYLSDAIALDPNHAGAYIARAVLITYAEIEKNTKQIYDPNRELAILDLTKAIDLDPQYSDAYFEAGTAQFCRGTILLINIYAALINGQKPSAAEVEQLEADMTFANELGLADAQGILDVIAQLKQIL